MMWLFGRLVVLLSALYATNLLGQKPAATQTVCTNADLKGDFVAQPRGILIGGPYAGPFSATGVLHFDGNGGFTGTAATSFFGHVIYPFPADGIYSVSPDCVVSILEQILQIPFLGFISRDRDEVLMFEPAEGTLTTNTLHRVLPALSCTNSSLTGNWVIGGTGTDVTNGDLRGEVGRVSFDGKGNMTGTLYTTTAGVQRQTTLIGTYTVNKNCTILGREVDAVENIRHWFAVLYDKGDRMLYNYIEDGLVFAGQGQPSVN